MPGTPNSDRKYFGTDGIRGRANVPPMTPEFVLRLGRALTRVARRGKSRAPRIVIGKDTRLSGYLLETALASGICSMGGRVMLSGPIPTPAVANLTVSMRADAGVVISASHNPYADNGIKLFGPDGFKLPDTEELEIESWLDSSKLDESGTTGANIGRAERLDDAVGRYVVYVKNTFPKDLSLEGLKLVVDAAHGAAYRVAPAVFSELGATVIPLGCRPNGRNINHQCGALYPEHVAKVVKTRGADFGIALDGDADRLIVVDEKGQVLDGDTVMAICATRMLASKHLAKKTLVATVMSNLGLERAIAGAGGKLKRTAVGDRHVVSAMRRSGLNLGGEQSGHLIFSDHATTGDGLVAALQLLAILVREQRPLSELTSVMQRVPQVLESLVLKERRDLQSMPKLSETMAAIERELGNEGRILVRWSGTEPKLRYMLEGPRPSQLKQMLKDLKVATLKDTKG